jgi:MFS family permease
VYAALVFLFVFVGGFSVMSLELLAGRVLAPYFGSSVHVWGSIIGVYMLALSVGYLLGGSLSTRRPRVDALGVLFLLSAACCLPLLLADEPLLEAVFERVEDPRYGSLAASMLLFFLPTVAMGTLSPYAVRLLVMHRGHSGQVAGRLYFVSTLGSALGVFLTSFYLVLLFEVRQIVLGVVVALGAAGIAAFAAGRLGASPAPAAEPAPAPERQPETAA